MAPPPTPTAVPMPTASHPRSTPTSCIASNPTTAPKVNTEPIDRSKPPPTMTMVAAAARMSVTEESSRMLWALVSVAKVPGWAETPRECDQHAQGERQPEEARSAGGQALSPRFIVGVVAEVLGWPWPLAAGAGRSSSVRTVVQPILISTPPPTIALTAQLRSTSEARRVATFSPKPQDGYPIGDLEHLRDVVGDQENGQLSLTKAGDQRNSTNCLLPHPKRCCWFIQQEDVPRPDRGSGDGNALALAAGQHPNRGVHVAHGNRQLGELVPGPGGHSLAVEEAETPGETSTADLAANEDVGRRRAIVSQSQVLVDSLDSKLAGPKRESRVTAWLITAIAPESGWATPAASFMSVDFPAPLSPSKAWISPARTSRSTSFKASMCP